MNKKHFDNYQVKKNYSKFLKGKRVVLVGPAWYTKNLGQRSLIESYDIIVRMNFGIRIRSNEVKKHIGHRTDILYSALSKVFFDQKLFTYRAMAKYAKNLKWICVTCPRQRAGGIRKFKKFNKRTKISFHRVNPQYYEYLYTIVKYKLTTGIITIYDLLQHDIKELFIIGMNFFDTTLIKKRRIYYSQYRDIPYARLRSRTHNLKREMKLFDRWCKKDKRIVCDNILQKTIEKYLK